MYGIFTLNPATTGSATILLSSLVRTASSFIPIAYLSESLPSQLPPGGVTAYVTFSLLSPIRVFFLTLVTVNCDDSFLELPSLVTVTSLVPIVLSSKLDPERLVYITSKVYSVFPFSVIPTSVASASTVGIIQNSLLE